MQDQSKKTPISTLQSDRIAPDITIVRTNERTNEKENKSNHLTLIKRDRTIFKKIQEVAISENITVSDLIFELYAKYLKENGYDIPTDILEKFTERTRSLQRKRPES